MNTTLTRNSYGELLCPTTASESDRTLYMLAQRLATNSNLDAEVDTIEFDRKRRASGEAVHHELYDVNEDGTLAIFCVRKTEGSKYGVSTISKEYFLLDEKSFISLPKSKVVRLAKASVGQTGVLISILKEK